MSYDRYFRFDYGNKMIVRSMYINHWMFLPEYEVASIHNRLNPSISMMTSSNGKIFRVTGSFRVIVPRIHRSPGNCTQKGQWSGALMFSLICASINGWVNTHEACDLRRHRHQYDVTLMSWEQVWTNHNWHRPYCWIQNFSFRIKLRKCIFVRSCTHYNIHPLNANENAKAMLSNYIIRNSLTPAQKSDKILWRRELINCVSALYNHSVTCHRTQRSGSHDCHIIHYDDVIIGAIASQITSLTIVYSAVYSGTDQSKHQSSASLAFVWGSHRGPVNSPHKWPVTRKILPFHDVIMQRQIQSF